ncbi:hypothetical protein [Tunicatimonas pelagia]|uniref:hypothetical protein n=1 Tax=Tunicatimonas pelagia TaxID=931531 RepID=UPI002665111E|nr:hypothetical protein [Tunicatimonas pelagia]WKN46406.1 hypothetical protein P0M28_18050 [Tunicatimonas pelagia]
MRYYSSGNRRCNDSCLAVLDYRSIKYLLTIAAELILLLSLLSSCRSISEKAATESSEFEVGVPLGLIDDDRLEEVSGLVASRNNPGMVWVHNDSGNPAEIYLLDNQAELRAIYTLGEKQRDWEDMAIGPGPVDGVTYLYVGDIGDNFTLYSEDRILRLPEPTLPSSQRIYTDTVHRIDTITFVYPDEQWDAETLLLDPLTKNLYLLTKEMSFTQVYCLPYPQRTDTVIVAQHLLTIPFEGENLLDRLVAGDISADGQELLLKTYQHVFYRVKAEPTLSFTDWIISPTDTLPYIAEPQGEAIGFAADGSGYYTLSESQIGRDLYLYFYPRQSRSEQ